MSKLKELVSFIIWMILFVLVMILLTIEHQPDNTRIRELETKVNMLESEKVNE